MKKQQKDKKRRFKWHLNADFCFFWRVLTQAEWKFLGNRGSRNGTALFPVPADKVQMGKKVLGASWMFLSPLFFRQHCSRSVQLLKYLFYLPSTLSSLASKIQSIDTGLQQCMRSICDIPNEKRKECVTLAEWRRHAVWSVSSWQFRFQLDRLATHSSFVLMTLSSST